MFLALENADWGSSLAYKQAIFDVRLVSNIILLENLICWHYNILSDLSRFLTSCRGNSSESKGLLHVSRLRYAATRGVFWFSQAKKTEHIALVGQTFDKTRRNFTGLYSEHSAKFYRDNAWKSKLHDHCNIDNCVKKIQQSMFGAWGAGGWSP